jgi:putative FmdB family regulatory protein
MPIYVFTCKKHGEIDIRLSVSEIDDIQLCPKCKKQMKRKFLPIKINFRQPLGGGNSKKMEIYTNSKDAEDQLFSQITEDE